MALHPDDERALDFTFDPVDYADEREQKIADALGVDLNAVRGLEGALVTDLQWPDHSAFGDVARVDVDPSRFGISWWTGYSGIGVGRRILVGDYLIETTRAIETNLLEARLHFSAIRAAFAATPTNLTALPRPTELLRGTFVQLHIAGMLRAVGSAIDCVGAVAIGVLGLPISIKRGDYGRVHQWVAERAPKLAPSPALDFQLGALSDVFAAFESLAPTGWLDWASSFRNTFVHRGRRHQQLQSSVGLRLPSEPNRSELESRLASHYPECLNEPCVETLAGTMRNAQAATFQACTILLGAWQHRRAKPDFIDQPRAQWPDEPPLDVGVSFVGFAPRKIADPDVVVTNHSNAKRYAASATDRRLKHLWESWR